MQDRIHSGQTGGMQDRKHLGKVGCRTGGMQDRADAALPSFASFGLLKITYRLFYYYRFSPWWVKMLTHQGLKEFVFSEIQESSPILRSWISNPLEFFGISLLLTIK